MTAADSQVWTRSELPVASVPIDRQKTCPFLLRVFCSERQHHDPRDFEGRLPGNEYQIYTWKDATIKELSSLIQMAYAPAKDQKSRLSFRIIARNLVTGECRVQDIGVLPVDIDNFQVRHWDLSKKTIGDDFRFKFEIGDYLDVAVLQAPARSAGVSARGLVDSYVPSSHSHRNRD
eukprot:Partr_v1_DN28756_c1_g2_i4_m61690 putative histone deacetylase complex subunit